MNSDKIFDNEIQSYLKGFGITEKQIAEVKFKKAKEIVLNTLTQVRDLIQNDNYQAVSQYLKFSGAGDGYGDNNNYIAFEIGNTTFDIDEVCSYLTQLKQLMK